VAGCCEHGNEPSGSKKGVDFLDQVSDYHLPKKDSDPWGSLEPVCPLLLSDFN
jgi:hypothetical protein